MAVKKVCIAQKGNVKLYARYLFGKKVGYFVPEGSYYSIEERHLAFEHFRNITRKTFRVDVGDHYYLLLDAPDLYIARLWTKEIPEPQDIISVRQVYPYERELYIEAGFQPYHYLVPMMETE